MRGHEILKFCKIFYFVDLKFDIYFFFKNTSRHAHQNAHRNIMEDGTAVEDHPRLQVLSSELLRIFSRGLRVK